MHNKIVFIAIFLTAIGGFGEFTEIVRHPFKPKAGEHKPYMFTTRDRAELMVMKFIKAIETGDIKTAQLLMEKGANYNKACAIISEFYSKHYQGKAKKYLILYPREFILSDSLAAMHFEIKNALKPNENKEAILLLVNKENQWLIKTSSSFFKVLQQFSGKIKEQNVEEK